VKLYIQYKNVKKFNELFASQIIENSKAYEIKVHTGSISLNRMTFITFRNAAKLSLRLLSKLLIVKVQKQTNKKKQTKTQWLTLPLSENEN
jgi:hypothetical protein